MVDETVTSEGKVYGDSFEHALDAYGLTPTTPVSSLRPDPEQPHPLDYAYPDEQSKSIDVQQWDGRWIDPFRLTPKHLHEYQQGMPPSAPRKPADALKSGDLGYPTGDEGRVATDAPDYIGGPGDKLAFDTTRLPEGTVYDRQSNTALEEALLVIKRIYSSTTDELLDDHYGGDRVYAKDWAKFVDPAILHKGLAKDAGADDVLRTLEMIQEAHRKKEDADAIEQHDFREQIKEHIHELKKLQVQKKERSPGQPLDRRQSDRKRETKPATLEPIEIGAPERLVSPEGEIRSDAPDYIGGPGDQLAMEMRTRLSPYTDTKAQVAGGGTSRSGSYTPKLEKIWEFNRSKDKPDWSSVEPMSDKIFTFKDPKGNTIQLNTAADPTGKNIYVNWVGREGINPFRFSNEIGTSGMRSLLRQLKEHYPEMETIGGNRISGARAKVLNDKLASEEASSPVNPRIRMEDLYEEYLRNPQAFHNLVASSRPSLGTEIAKGVLASGAIATAVGEEGEQKINEIVDAIKQKTTRDLRPKRIDRER